MNSTTRLILISAAITWAGGPRSLMAQDLVIPRLSEPIEVDGQVHEDVWQTIPILPVTMFEPVFDGEITRPTSIRIAHDGDFLYASAVFLDDDVPRAETLVRDGDGDDDVFNLVLDTFRDGRSALWFAVTPAGVQLDGALTDDAEGSDWNHLEYDSFWDAEAVIHPWGWSAEMKIPMSSLRFESVEGRVVMGLIAGRKVARHRERYTFPAIRPGPSYAQFKPSLSTPVIFEGVSDGQARYLTPYALFGASKNSAIRTPDWTSRGEAGGELKLGLTQDMVLDLTVNTDFSQTELDDERINLTRFNLFVPEKRRFFLDRAGVFAFGDGEEHRLFHSRTIGLDAVGAPERVYGGARLVGRSGQWDVGLLTMQTEGAGTGSINNAAIRARRAMGTGSYLGGMFTSLVRTDGSTALASGVDGEVRLTGMHHVSWNVAGSRSEVQEQTRTGIHARLLLADRDREGLGYRVEIATAGSGYAPPLGFLLRHGGSLDVTLRHGEFGGDFLQERIVSVQTTARVRDDLSSLESATAGLSLTGIRRGGGDGGVVLRINHERLDHTFPISGTASIPEGDYTFMDGQFTISTPTARDLRASVTFTGGTFFDGRRLSAALQPAWTASRHLEFFADLELNSIEFATRGTSFEAAIVRLRAQWALDKRLSTSALLQFNSATRSRSANVRLRYHFREGADLFLVVTAGRGDRFTAVTSDSAPWTQNSMLMKYSHALSW